MTEVTLPNAQLLLDRPKGEGMIVSCYKNEVARLEQRLAGDPEARR